jgi:hypothetical protein
MSELKFSDEQYSKPNLIQKSVRADSFGISTFLIKKGIVKNIRAAKRLSNLFMMVFILIALLLIIISNVSRSESNIDEKYYYDPTQID